MEQDRRPLFKKIGMLGAAALTVAGLVCPSGACAGGLKTLYSFCAQGGANCTDGANPLSGVIKDAAGNLYGTTSAGGAYGWGTVFELIPSAGPWGQTFYTERVLHSFCSQGGGRCNDGAYPILWKLFMDASGNLYGTTIYGGANSTYLGAPGSSGYPSTSGYAGVVFELSPNAGKTAWTYKVLHSFCAEGGAGCTDGRGPQSGVTMGPSGRLYGTASEGGAQNPNCRNGACGVVFELSPNADKSTWTETVLYAFCKQGGAICADGANPHSGVRFAFGGLLGNADQGGGAYSKVEEAPGAGTGGNVFLLTDNAPGAPWTYKVLYSFCSQPNCSDGSGPEQDSLVVDDAGRIFGMAFEGGIQGCSFLYGNGCGVVFELSPNADKTGWTEQVLYAFCAVGGSNCTDGSAPDSGLIADPSGNLFGTTVLGGANNQNGVLFALTRDAYAKGQSAGIEPVQYAPAATAQIGQDGRTSWTERGLYNFCAEGGANCTDSGGGGSGVLFMDATGGISTARHSGAALMAGAWCSS